MRVRDSGASGFANSSRRRSSCRMISPVSRRIRQRTTGIDCVGRRYGGPSEKRVPRPTGGENGECQYLGMEQQGRRRQRFGTASRQKYNDAPEDASASQLSQLRRARDNAESLLASYERQLSNARDDLENAKRTIRNAKESYDADAERCATSISGRPAGYTQCRMVRSGVLF